MYERLLQSVHIQKKGAASTKKKKNIFFHFQGAHFFHATCILMHETPKIGPDDIIVIKRLKLKKRK